jgi:hypothetical protein
LTAPSALIPVTRTRIVRPESADTRRYVFCVAPAMFAQAAPLALQRCHWYWKAVGLLLQAPFCAVNDSPTRAVPMIVGADELAGGAATAGAAQTQNAPIIAPKLRTTRVVFTVKILSVRITSLKR